MNGESKEFIAKEILRLLNEKYPPGLYQFLYEYRPNLYRQLQEIESEIDHGFLFGTIEEFKKAFRDYWIFHVKAIQIFEISKVKIDLTKNQKEVPERMLM